MLLPRGSTAGMLPASYRRLTEGPLFGNMDSMQREDVNSIMQELLAISDLSRGSVLRKSDLHVHTPASLDMDKRWRNATAADVVGQALDAELEIIAITDHNTAEWCDLIREAANGTSLHVFPGVEVSTSEGHVLAVFDPSKPLTEIREFLIRIGIREQDYGNLEALAEGRLDGVAAEIEREGGLAIAAHVDRPKGFWGMMEDSRTRRKQIYQCDKVHAFELVDTERRDDFLNGRINGYGRKVACVQGSDSYRPGGDRHQVDAVGNRHCYIAMDEVSIVGLKLAFLDPDVRIRFSTDPRPVPDSAIEGVWVSGGFLDKQLFAFNNNITCLIGDTGSGKSLTLELMRYVLDQRVDENVLPKIGREVTNLLSFGLDELSSAYVLIRKADERYVVERPWLPGSNPSSVVSRVVDGNLEQLEETIHIPGFFPIRAFSQTEIVEYAREPLARLSLIDDLIDIEKEQDSIDDIKGALRGNATELINLREKLDKAENSVQELPGLREEVGRLSDLLTDKAVRQYGAWTTEREVLDAAAASMDDLESQVIDLYESLDTSLLETDDLPKTTPSLGLRRELTELETAIRSAFTESRKNLEASLRDKHVKLVGIRKAWKRRFKKAKRKYNEAVAKSEATGRSKAALEKNLASLQIRERRLKKTQRRIDDKYKPGLAQLREERETQLTELQRNRRVITSLRKAKAKQLTKTLNREVTVKIGSEKDSRDFQRRLLDLREGSHLRETDINVAASELHPVPMVKSLLSREFDEPANESGLQPEFFEKFVDNVHTKNRLGDLYELQLVDLPDVVKIQFAVDGGEYRDLEKLAHGQKCTVVLMIALAEGDFPLLVDQPEDALHAPWIENYIATTLRRRRGLRQCIFATRNANVLVSADAEQIIALKADAMHGEVDKTGALDRFNTRDLVIYHIEGGAESFERRQQKYDLGSRS